MITIEIMPSARGAGGYYISSGHARQGQEAVCAAVTAIEECLAANLRNTWNVRCHRTAEKGRYDLRWTKTDRKGAGLSRANQAAGFAFTGLQALSAMYPDDVVVKWLRPETANRERSDFK